MCVRVRRRVELMLSATGVTYRAALVYRYRRRYPFIITPLCARAYTLFVLYVYCAFRIPGARVQNVMAQHVHVRFALLARFPKRYETFPHTHILRARLHNTRAISIACVSRPRNTCPDVTFRLRNALRRLPCPPEIVGRI